MRSRLRAVALSLALAGACDTRPVPATSFEPQRSTTDPATAVPLEQRRGFLGVVIASATVDIVSQLDSRLLNITARQGDRVVRGQMLARLDTKFVDQQLAAAEADVAIARAEVERNVVEVNEAKEHASRRATTVTLPGGNTVSTSSQEEISTSAFQLQKTVVRTTAARATLQEKEARRDELRALLVEATLRAPFSGTVAQRYLDQGAPVRKGAPVLRLIQSDGLWVRFAVPEGELSGIDVGKGIRLRSEHGDASGTIEKVAPEIDAAARVVFVDAALDTSQSSKTRSGEVVRVWLANETHARR